MVDNSLLRHNSFEELPFTERIHDSKNRLPYWSVRDVSRCSNSFVSADTKVPSIWHNAPQLMRLLAESTDEDDLAVAAQ
jgi:hypothetical protein